MNTQQLFNKSVLGVIAQGVQSSTSTGACLYRGPNGARCAIGQIISDESYSSCMEQNSFSRYNAAGYAIRATIGRELSATEVRLLIELQGAHDADDHTACEISRTDWLNSFIFKTKRLAKEFNLSYPLHTQRAE